MAEPSGPSFLLRLQSIDQLFNGVDANPFSSSEQDILGQPALESLLTQMQVHSRRDWSATPLTIALPPDQVTPDLQARTVQAIQRYCQARIDENDLQVRLSRKQHTFGMVLVLVIALVATVIGYLLLSTLLAGASSVLQAIVAGAVCVFVWVILWDPLEALLFDWAAPARENRVLRGIMAMPVVIQAQS